MPYVTIPKDLTKVKTKVLFNLTRRQLICFGTGIAVGLPLFFLLKAPLGNSLASLLMILAMVPAFLFAVYEKNGQPMEVIGRNMVRALFLRQEGRRRKTGIQRSCRSSLRSHTNCRRFPACLRCWRADS